MRRAIAAAALLAALVGTTACGGSSTKVPALEMDSAKMAPAVLSFSVERVFEAQTKADCESIGSTCENSHPLGTDCQHGDGDAWLWDCGTQEQALDGNLDWEYIVTTDRNNCWSAILTDDPDQYHFVGRMHGCVTGRDRANAALADLDNDGYIDA